MKLLEEFWPDWRSEINTQRQTIERARPLSQDDKLITLLQVQDTILKGLFWLLEEANAGES